MQFPGEEGIVEEDVAKEEFKPDDNLIANLVAGYVFEAAKENEQIAEAVEVTGSNLFELLLGDEEQEAEMNLIDFIAEEPSEDFEAELEKVTDYINEQEGNKQAALDLLNLVHGVVDEIHVANSRRAKLID